MWRLDVKGAEVRTAFGEAGIPCLLLKGRAFAALFYGDDPTRSYGDCDLLVPASLATHAQSVLTDLGFSLREGARHSSAWLREVDNVWVDLHSSLPVLDIDPEYVWMTLWPRAVWLRVGGAPTLMLDAPAAALLAALHLVHHGPDALGPTRDLERAVYQLGADEWRGTADLARTLSCEAALGTGLRLLPAGATIADRLGLEWAPTAQMLLLWHNAPWGATIWENLATASGMTACARILAAFLIPSPRFLRGQSALARRGPAGLLVSYFVRPFRLTAKATASFAPWWRLRRDPGAPKHR